MGRKLAYHTEPEAAEILGLSDRTLRTYRRKGLIHCYRFPGGRIRYADRHLFDFLNRCEQAGKSDPNSQGFPPVS